MVSAAAPSSACGTPLRPGTEPDRGVWSLAANLHTQGPVLRAIERSMARQRAKPASSDDLLLEPSLVALRKAMASPELPIQSISLHAASVCQKPAEQAEDGPIVSLAGAGAPASDA